MTMIIHTKRKNMQNVRFTKHTEEHTKRKNIHVLHTKRKILGKR